MSKLETEFHRVMGQTDTPSAWLAIFHGAADRLNDLARGLVARPEKNSKLAAYVQRLNPTMRANLVANWKPWRPPGGVDAGDDMVSGHLTVGEGDAQVMADTRGELEATVKQAIIAEMLAEPKTWLTPTLVKRTHGRPKN